MPNRSHAFYAACILTTVSIMIAAALAYFGPDPTPQSITRILDTLLFIAGAGALAIFGLLGSQSDKMPPGNA